MDNKEFAKKIIIENNGVAKTADFVSAGIKAGIIVALCNSGYLERIRHGYYRLADRHEISEPQAIKSLIPQGIVCVESALFYYGYSDFTPRKWSLAVPRTITRSKLQIDELPVKPYYMKPEIYEIGITYKDFSGVTLPVYDRERTICDCFKYRSKLDNETFNKAVYAYASDNNKNLTALSAYAKKLRVYKKVTELMEVILNG